MRDSISYNFMKDDSRMSRKRIGALTIGQSPRSDLVEPLEIMLPDCDVIQAGALDSLVIEELPAAPTDGYPLMTRMRDGTGVTVEEDFILPKLQSALDRLEAEGVAATLLMCAGTFSGLHSRNPLFVPFTIGHTLLRTFNFVKIGIVTPTTDQEAPTHKRWENKGFQPSVWTADLGVQDRDFYCSFKEKIKMKALACIILDYFGHPTEQVEALQEKLDIPIIDLGRLVAVTLASTLQQDIDAIGKDEE